MTHVPVDSGRSRLLRSPPPPVSGKRTATRTPSPFHVHTRYSHHNKGLQAAPIMALSGPCTHRLWPGHGRLCPPWLLQHPMHGAVGHGQQNRTLGKQHARVGLSAGLKIKAKPTVGRRAVAAPVQSRRSTVAVRAGKMGSVKKVVLAYSGEWLTCVMANTILITRPTSGFLCALLSASSHGVTAKWKLVDSATVHASACTPRPCAGPRPGSRCGPSASQPPPWEQLACPASLSSWGH